MPPGKYLADGLQSGCTANLTGTQYKIGNRDAIPDGTAKTEENNKMWNTESSNAFG